MKKGAVIRKMLLVSISALFMTACSHKQPQLQQVKLKQQKLKQPQEINATTKKKEEPILSSTQEEKWVPLTMQDEIEWKAKELLGLKYVWGATGPINYDCSGFTQKIYGEMGIHIPRVSRNQAEKGELISFENLKKGDLVFFSTNRKRPGKVTHVGIYLGNNNFIHASSAAKKIIICNFEKNPFYKKHFLWARRILHPKQYVASNDEETNLESAI